MRTRTIFLIVAILLMAGFAMLNVDEFTRSSLLSLGFTTVQVPLGLLMLLIIVAILLVFLATTIYMQSANMIESRHHTKELAIQRELADKAEASRFTELRHYMESQAKLADTRDKDALASIDSRLSRTETALLKRLEESDNTTAAYIGQMQDSMSRGALIAAR